MSSFNNPLQWAQISACAAVAMTAVLSGCTADSFMDPSRTGRFEAEPTMIPILDRIDVIEDRDDRWARTTEPTQEDLLPNDLTYRLTPGDFITVEIFELFMTGEWTIRTTRVDASGNIRLPVVGDIVAAGQTAQELEDRIKNVLQADLVVLDPEVHVLVEEGSAFSWIIRGEVQVPGQYTLRDPDLRLLQALAQAGDISTLTGPSQPNRIFVIRQVPLTDEFQPSYEQDPGGGGGTQPAQPGGNRPVDVEDLIDQLNPPVRDDSGSGGGDDGSGDDGGSPLVDIDAIKDDSTRIAFSPGAMQDPPPVDIDDLDPQVNTPQDEAPAQDIGATDTPRSGDISYIYDEERGQWIPVRRPGTGEDDAAGVRDRPLAIERIIEIPYQPLAEGQARYNIVIRPNDYIFVEPPEVGLIYIDGEVPRPGSFNLPIDGSRLTLSRAISVAGGLGPLATPTRVDLTRVVGDDREATIRLDLAAIRQRTQPDIYLKPMDHIIVGTDFWATPLAVIRNGFRVTYGFGFLLDRNFGNDVFGAPPTNVNRE